MRLTYDRLFLLFQRERERERLGSMQFGSVIDKPRFKTAFPPYFVRRDWNNKSPRARQCSNRINTPPPAFQNRRKTGRSRNNNFSTPNSETDFRDGQVYKGNNDPWNVLDGNVSQEFRQDKSDCYLSLVYTRTVIQFSRVFPPADFHSGLAFGGHFSPVCRVFREQTFAKPVKLASHFKVESGPALV